MVWVVWEWVRLGWVVRIRMLWVWVLGMVCECNVFIVFRI